MEEVGRVSPHRQTLLGAQEDVMMRGTLARVAVGIAAVGGAVVIGHSAAVAQATVNICTVFQAGDGINCDGGSNTLSVRFGTSATDVLEGNDSRIPNVAKAASALTGKYVGTFTVSTEQAGVEENAIYDGSRLGQRALDALCANAFSGSHSCSFRELQYAVGRGEVTSGVGIAIDTHPYAVYDYAPFDGTGDNVLSNLKGNCGNFAYGTGDYYTRTVWRVVNLNPDSVGGVTGTVLQLDYGTAAGACSVATDRVIACCN